MFDIGWQEIFIIGLLALIVVGPKDLPRAIKIASGWFGRAKSLAREFQSGLDEVVREAELDDIKQQITGAADVDLDLEADIRDALDPTGELEKDMDLGDLGDLGDDAESAAPEQLPATAADPAPPKKDAS